MTKCTHALVNTSYGTHIHTFILYWNVVVVALKILTVYNCVTTVPIVGIIDNYKLHTHTYCKNADLGLNQE